MDMEENNTVNEKPVVGPGASLAAARESAGMTQEQVADKLHLSPRQIAALEDNRYEDLPEAPYVRGYIRNYALLLKQDEAALVEAFNATQSASKKSVENRQQLKKESLASQKKADIKADGVRLAVAGAVVLLVVIALVWALGSGESDNSIQPPVSSQITDKHFALTGQQDSTESLADQPPAIIEQAAEATSDSMADTAQVESVPAPTEEPVASSAANASKATESPVVAKIQEQVIENRGVQAPQPDNKNLSKIILYVEADSWADVRDASDNKMIYKTVSGGSVVTLEGKSPIKVFLGNAEAVKLFYNGQEYDFSKYRRGLVARFTLQ